MIVFIHKVISLTKLLTIYLFYTVSGLGFGHLILTYRSLLGDVTLVTACEKQGENCQVFTTNQGHHYTSCFTQKSMRNMPSIRFSSSRPYEGGIDEKRRGPIWWHNRISHVMRSRKYLHPIAYPYLHADYLSFKASSFSDFIFESWLELNTTIHQDP